MADGVMPQPPAFATIRRLSPSRYVALTQCALREAWAASRAPALLPARPGARPGTVAHTLLENAGRGKISGQGADAVRAEWDRLIAEVEGRMRSSWLERPLVPLRASVRDYEVRRLRAEAQAARIAAEPALIDADVAYAGGAGGAGAAAVEMPVATKDGRAGGIIDRVRETADGPVLVDYKSGAIVADGGEMTVAQEGYRVQLKLYAALYAETTGRWPVRLELAPPDGPPTMVPFTADECRTLLADALTTLDHTNATISRLVAAPSGSGERDVLANPHPSACGWCQYRPACMAYRRARHESSGTVGGAAWPVDVWGKITARRVLHGGQVGLGVRDDGGKETQIRALSTADDRHPALAEVRVGDPIAIFNLDGRHAPHMLTERAITVLYRYPSRAQVAGGPS